MTNATYAAPALLLQGGIAAVTQSSICYFKGRGNTDFDENPQGNKDAVEADCDTGIPKP